MNVEMSDAEILRRYKSYQAAEFDYHTEEAIGRPREARLHVERMIKDRLNNECLDKLVELRDGLIEKEKVAARGPWWKFGLGGRTSEVGPTSPDLVGVSTYSTRNREKAVP